VAADLIDHLHDEHAVSMIRSLRGGAGRMLIALLDAAPGEAIAIEGSTTQECLERLHQRVESTRYRPEMPTMPDLRRLPGPLPGDEQ
jgi:hypothetical protein